jgi:hypothetical protein
LRSGRRQQGQRRAASPKHHLLAGSEELEKLERALLGVVSGSR